MITTTTYSGRCTCFETTGDPCEVHDIGRSYYIITATNNNWSHNPPAPRLSRHLRRVAKSYARRGCKSFGDLNDLYNIYMRSRQHLDYLFKYVKPMPIKEYKAHRWEKFLKTKRRRHEHSPFKNLARSFRGR